MVQAGSVRTVTPSQQAANHYANWNFSGGPSQFFQRDTPYRGPDSRSPFSADRGCQKTGHYRFAIAGV